MNKLGIAALLALGCSVPAFAQVGVSVQIGEPGFYGQINLGDYAPPQVIYQQPVVVRAVPEYAGVAPIYLRVPPGYERHWKRHCGEYQACGRPVYFVRDEWYQREVVPRYHHDERRDGYDHDHGHGRGDEHGDGRGDWHEHGDHGDHGRDHDH